ncbi:MULTISPECIES: hypothetical protein [Microbacterium]|jgi:hypothetical protein|uniref:ATP synthase protein I2 n=1 Tax=Microbacterium algeriense TaxID=2615184 RepID=A0ABQ6V5I9_9MICO|nr:MULTISPECIES: hypothetical protein [Microbacterium]AZH78241.1 hypothetical protein CSX12_07090 [Microbacterium sp. Y-01]KAB1864361.1 hypothetical protein F6A08_09605 [Microbacterium algeriense]MDX2398342.1 hypothetical protein [Microbacterium algeriense]
MSPSPVSSTPILRRTLIWSAVATGVLAVVAGGVGFLVAQGEGLVSGLLGVLLAALFLAITGISILIANRWYGDPLYVQLFFAIVLGGWLLKLGVFVLVMILLAGQPWLDPMVFFLSIVAGVLMSLAIDVVVLTQMRLPSVSDTTLPTEVPEDRAPGTANHIDEGPVEEGPRS